MPDVEKADEKNADNKGKKEPVNSPVAHPSAEKAAGKEQRESGGGGEVGEKAGREWDRSVTDRLAV